MDKPPKTLDNLRALALQEAVGKAVTGLLAKLALKQSFEVLSTWPQYAYLPKRSAQDAICRVVAHCDAARALVATQSRTVHNRSLGCCTHQICGGIQLYIDLSRAFDSVRRADLFDGLDTCGISPDLQALLAALHQNTQYHLYHRDEFHNVFVNKGVRQGCKVAPLLWACLMTQFMHRLAQKLGPQRAKEHVTLFADDLQLGGLFHSMNEWTALMKSFGIVLDELESMGLTINVTKSQLLCRLAGSNHRNRKLSSQIIQRTADGAWIELPSQKATKRFPLRSTAKYLGVHMSYYNFESLTFQMRLAAGQNAFRRLHTWLTSKHLGQKHRLKLWRSCVFPVLTYGLFTVGISNPHMHKLQSVMYTMLRMILHDHAYRTGHTYQQALAIQRCLTPLQLLHRAALALHQSVTQRLPSLPADDIVHTLNWSRLEQVIQLFVGELHQGPPVPVSADITVEPPTQTVLCCQLRDLSRPTAAI